MTPTATAAACADGQLEVADSEPAGAFGMGVRDGKRKTATRRHLKSRRGSSPLFALIGCPSSSCRPELYPVVRVAKVKYRTVSSTRGATFGILRATVSLLPVNVCLTSHVFCLQPGFSRSFVRRRGQMLNLLGSSCISSEPRSQITDIWDRSPHASVCAPSPPPSPTRGAARCARDTARRRILSALLLRPARERKPCTWADNPAAKARSHSVPDNHFLGACRAWEQDERAGRVRLRRTSSESLSNPTMRQKSHAYQCVSQKCREACNTL